jgi:hypothetical protein
LDVISTVGSRPMLPEGGCRKEMPATVVTSIHDQMAKQNKKMSVLAGLDGSIRQSSILEVRV